MAFSEIEALFRSFIERNNILARIEEIEKWMRDQAAPSIKTNVTNIQNINTNITNNLLPKIEESVKIATDSSNTAIAASNQAISFSNIAVEAKNIAEGFLKRIEDAETNAVNASENALNAFNSVQDFANRLLETGKQLQTDLDKLMEAESKFRTVLLTELDGVKNQIFDFSNAIKAEGDNVKAKGTVISNVVNAMQSEMQRPLFWIDTYIKRAQVKGHEIFIPFNIGISVGVIAAKGIVLGLEGIDPENPTLVNYFTTPGNNAVLEELVIGLQQTGTSLLALALSLGEFGGIIQAEGTKLGDRLVLASKLINNSFKEFIDLFHTIFNNMAFRLRGEVPPV